MSNIYMHTPTGVIHSFTEDDIHKLRTVLAEGLSARGLRNPLPEWHDLADRFEKVYAAAITD